MESSDKGQQQQAETDKKTSEQGGGNSSILGSLEQLVKGNFQGNSRQQQQQRQGGGPSPPVATAAGSSILNPGMAKFSIQSMFPKQEQVPPTSPGNSSGSSKPNSPSSSRPSSAGQPSSLERRGGEVGSGAGGGETNGKVKPETDYSGSARGTPSPIGTPVASFSSARASPKSERSEEEAVSGNKATSEKSENPLAALQMLCDTQKKSPKLGGQRPPHAPETSQMSDPGAMLAFSWACNQAQVSNDSVIKCPFCDTPFISKGAYRHHLSKMHFTKEGGGVGGVSGGAALPPGAGSGASPASTVGGLQPSTGAQSPSPPPPHPDAKEDETLQSKYHKYAQLAKQLSCNQK